ncbi:FecR family protein [Methylomonas sp. EbA]|uniref:FecR family protein n=2 Tax=Methylomonas albis TaxID=1854563 RepID=A0ABR9CXZ2_9GAMM|nr:FecR family protein [Methylomonas albis]
MKAHAGRPENISKNRRVIRHNSFNRPHLMPMSNAPVSEITTLSDQAIDWVIRLRAGNAGAQERRAAAEWQNRSPSHRRAFAEAEQLWLDMGEVWSVTELPRPTQAMGRRFSRPVWRGLAAAALALALVLPFSGLGDRWFSDYYTAVGEQKTVTLADGSQVLLNTDTALTVAYSDTGRKLTLKHGQALFKVAADRNRPFEVATDTAVVKALGTVFEVLQQDHAARITVQEHAVGVKGLHAPDYPPDARIQEGQQAVYSAANGLQAAVAADPQQSAAWQRGKLVFKNQALADVVAELDRYFPGKIVISDAKLAALRVSGVFPLADRAATLAMLQQILAVKISQITPWLTVLHG